MLILCIRSSLTSVTLVVNLFAPVLCGLRYGRSRAGIIDTGTWVGSMIGYGGVILGPGLMWTFDTRDVS